MAKKAARKRQKSTPQKKAPRRKRGPTNPAARKKAFLAAFEVCGSISAAAEAVPMGRNQHYVWMKEDPEYVVAFEECRHKAGELLEDRAQTRALEGSKKLVLYKGEPVEDPRNPGEFLYETTHDTTLQIFLLKALKPEKYRERQEVRHTTSESEEEWALIAGKTMEERKALVRQRLTSALNELN